MYDFRPVTSASRDLAPLQHLVDFRGLQVSLGPRHRCQVLRNSAVLSDLAFSA